MNFNFFFISYSVIYAKYNYCYDVPKEQPLRYFDGKEWKIVKPRYNIRTKVPRHSSLSVDLDWAELSEEIKEIKLGETTTEMPTFSTSITTTTKKATTERLKTKKVTIKKSTTKKLTTPKIILRALRRVTHPTTAKTILTHCRPICKLKLKNATTTTFDPLLLHWKMNTVGDWRDNWNFLRPTKKRSPVTSKKYTLKATKNYFIPTIKKVSVTTTRKIATTKELMTTTRKLAKPAKGSITTTRNSATPIRKPITTTKGRLITTEKPIQFSEKPVDDANPSGNWPNLLKEFLKYVEFKKCQRPPCDYETTTNTMPYSEYQLGNNRKTMSDDDDLMNILMDGVEIDDRRNREDDDASQIKDTLEYEGQRLNYESEEGSVSEMNNGYLQVLDQSLKDSIKTRRDAKFPKKMEYLKDFQTKNVNKDSASFHNRESEVYSDTYKDNSAIEEDEILQNDAVRSYSGKIKAKHTIKEYLNSEIKGSEVHLKNLKDKNTKIEDEVAQDIETKAYSDALKDMRANKNYIFSEVGRSEEYLDKLKNKNAREEDEILEDNEIKYSDALKDKYAKKVFITSRIRGSETYEILRKSQTKAYIDTTTDKHAKKDYMFSGIRESKIGFDELKDDNSQKGNEVLQTGIKKDYFTSQIKGSDINLDELKDKNARKKDEVIEDSEIKYYINSLKDKHAKKENEPSDSYLDAENIRHQDTDNLQDESTETFNSKELNEITDYVAPKLTYPIKLRSQTNNGDVLQDSDITFDLEA